MSVSRPGHDYEAIPWPEGIPAYAGRKTSWITEIVYVCLHRHRRPESARRCSGPWHPAGAYERDAEAVQ